MHKRLWLSLAPLALVLGVSLGAQPRLAAPASQAQAAQDQAAQNQAAIDPAYAAGYNAAYSLGVRDKAAGMTANAHKYSAYQDGMGGYHSSYGAPQSYRSRFQSGFADGYFDGYQGHARALPAPPPPPAVVPAIPEPAPTPAAAPITLDTTATANGYREGYNVGQSDANSSAVYNASASREYQQARVGYSAALGDATVYQTAFRKAFGQGYDDGYNHRLYNSAMGARDAPAPATPAPAASAARSNTLPTKPAELRARPSGVYANGLLVAQGTTVVSRLDKQLDTQNSYAGEAFSLTVTVPVWVGGVAAIPAGATIQGLVKQVQRGGKLSGHAQLQLQYTTLTLPGQAPIPLNATTGSVGNDAQSVDSSEGTVNGQNSNAGKKAATGAAIGAVLGGIFGGGGGLLKGGLAGAAVGTAGVLISHSKDMTLKQGETIAVKLQQPLQLPKSGVVQ